jgi:HlyD family secretion protein
MGKPEQTANADSSSPLKRVPDSVRWLMLTGIVAVVALVGGIGGWAATSELAGAVIADGTVVVDSSVKKVQHPTGGVVGEIYVRDGDKVAAGDLLLRLDETITRANLQIITGQLDQLAIRSARLVAERDGTSTLELPPKLAGRVNDPDLQAMLASERDLFASRQTARAGQKAQLRERSAQLDQEITGLNAQEQAKAVEIDLIRKELKGLLALQEKDLVPSIKVMSLQREAARLEGERGQLIAAAAQTKGKISEIELQIIQLDQDLKTEVMKELRELEAKQAELSERRIAAEDQLKRIDIRSPQAGVVHQLAVHTVGGVINQSEPLMLIVPEGDVLVIEAKVAPKDIDQLSLEQPAVILFPAFSQRTTPECQGKVARVSADLTKEPQLNQAYYLVRLSLSDAEQPCLGSNKLVPGMPAEVHIRTEERTALSYLMKPLTDQMARAFTEQ